MAGCSGDPSPPDTSQTLDDVTFDTLATVGVMDGDEREVFGSIWEVVAGPDGHFAVLDRQTPRISVFDASGDFVGEVAGAGEGPGELARPYALAWTPDGELLALDPANARISTFQIQSDGLEHVGSRRTEVWGTGNFCALDEGLFVAAHRDDHVIHQLNEAGRIDRSISAAPRPPEAESLEGTLRAIAMEDLAAVRLHCDPDRAHILEVGIMNPRIQLLEPDGTLIWSTELSEIFSLVPEVVNGGGVGMRVDEERGAHLARSVLPWDADHALIQYELRRLGPSPEGRQFHALDSRLIHTETGQEVARSNELPFLTAALPDERFLQLRNAPFPHVLILRRR